MQENWGRRIVWFLSGQTISLFGSMLVQYAIIWKITLETKSGLMITLSTLCGFLPQTLISVFAGVWADRYSRKRLIIAADALIALTTLAAAVCYRMNLGSIGLLLSVSAVRSLGAGIQTPAVNAILPQLVPDDKLTRVMGINTSVQSSLMLVAPVLSGWLMTGYAVESTFFIDVVTAAIAITILAWIHIPLHQGAADKTEQGGSHFADFMEGIRYVRTDKTVALLLVYFAVFSFVLVPGAFLTPLMSARTFGDDVWRLTVIEIAFAVGMMAGGGIIAAWGGLKNRIYTIALACLFYGAGTIAMGYSANFVMFSALMVFLGLTVPFFNTSSTVFFQQRVPPDMLGRVFGLIGTISTLAMPIGMAVFGPLADIIKIEWLLVASGALLCALGGGMFLVPAFRHLSTTSEVLNP